MSNTTPNLGLFKYDTSTDGKEVFSIQQALNNNWDILDNLPRITSNLEESGYLKLSNGLLINYGQASTNTQEKTWTQPTLSENGTLGGDSFACGYSGQIQTGNPYNAFDGNTSTGCYFKSSVTSYLKFYHPTGLRISQIQFYCQELPSYFTNVKLYASQTDSNYFELGTFSRNGNYWNVSISDNNFYKYFQISVFVNTQSSAVPISEVTITATHITQELSNITFPCAFTTTNYAYSLAYLNGTFGDSYATTLTTTGMLLHNDSGGDACYYLAIGH